MRNLRLKLKSTTFFGQKLLTDRHFYDEGSKDILVLKSERYTQLEDLKHDSNFDMIDIQSSP